MANLSSATRKEQVFGYLKVRINAWVDGPELANESVGGSEGLKRLRELRQDLRAEGRYDIEMRGHPDPRRDIFQYRLVERSPVGSTYTPPAPAVSHASDEPVSRERPPARQNAPARRSTSKLHYDPITDTYVALPGDPPQAVGQMDMGVPEAEQFKYDQAPTKLELGASILCPMCHGVHRAIREKDPITGKARKGAKVIGYEPVTKDPNKPSQPCPRCNGFGVIPNG